MAAACVANSWHRAEIKGFKSKKNRKNQMDKLVDVYYPDFGDSAYLSLKDLRKLPGKFYELPFQAIECSLDGVALYEHDQYWSEEAILHFEENVYSCKWKPLQLTLLTFKDDKPYVSLTDESKVLSIIRIICISIYNHEFFISFKGCINW